MCHFSEKFWKPFSIYFSPGLRFMAPFWLYFEKWKNIYKIIKMKNYIYSLKARYKTTTITESLVPRGGRKSSIPAISHDTLRDGRKGDPQHKCCGKAASSGLNSKIRKKETIPSAARGIRQAILCIFKWIVVARGLKQRGALCIILDNRRCGLQCTLSVKSVR